MRFRFSAVALLVAAPVLAQSRAATPAVRPLGPTLASTSVPIFTQIGHIRQLSDGRVIVNDPSRRQLTLLDTMLQNPVAIIDSTPGAQNTYGRTSGGLIEYKGDSSLFVDGTAQVFLVIDANGKIGRVMPLPPRATPSYFTSSITYGFPRISQGLGLLYRMTQSMRFPTNMDPSSPEKVTIKMEDSAYVLGYDLETRKLDTVTTFATGASRTMTIGGGSMMSSSGPGNLYPTYSDWAPMADGTLAILRGQEYRIEFINPDRTKTLGPRVPYNWTKLTDEDKQHMADSVNNVRKASYDAMLERRKQDSIARANPNAASSAATSGRGGDAAGGRGAPPPAGAAGGRGSSAAVAEIAAAAISGRMVMSDGFDFVMMPGGVAPVPQPPPQVTTNDFPDYLPAIQRTTATFMADADNNLWVRPRDWKTPMGASGAVYDILNRKGELIDRVQLPVGRTLAGFGKGGTVYLYARDAGVLKLEKARFK